MLSEANVISKICSQFPTHIGDDAAIVPSPAGQKYAITKDLLVENTHFRASYTDAKSLAHKALHVNLSDLAAMAAQPQWILLGLSIPPSLKQFIDDFIEHFTHCCQQAGVIIIGGDTTKASDQLFISITAIGHAATEHIKYRNKAKPNNIIGYIGNLGNAHLGLIALEKQKEGLKEYKNQFLYPKAKIAEGFWLGKQLPVTGMMDISDGLFIDLKRLCQASDLKGIIDLNALPSSPSFLRDAESLGKDPLSTMLTGGEDYGLLFTIDSAHCPCLAENFQRQFHYPIQLIGHTAHGSGVSFLKNGKAIDLDLHPFSHFGETP